MREENARLKRLVADLTLDKQILQEVIRKKAKASRPGTFHQPPAHRVRTAEIWTTTKLARVENADYIISIGSQPELASSLNRALELATSDMVNWLVTDYKVEPWPAHLTCPGSSDQWLLENGALERVGFFGPNLG